METGDIAKIEGQNIHGKKENIQNGNLVSKKEQEDDKKESGRMMWSKHRKRLR